MCSSVHHQFLARSLVGRVACGGRVAARSLVGPWDASSWSQTFKNVSTQALGIYYTKIEVKEGRACTAIKRL